MSRRCLTRPVLHLVSPPVQLPIFLVPAFVSAFHSTPDLSKSVSPARAERLAERLRLWKLQRRAPSPHREKNKNRGVSAIRRTGPRRKLSVTNLSSQGLPKPMLDVAERRKEFATNEKHGLWKFFNEEKKPMCEPEELGAHGRAWEYAELENKSFEDLHALYWTCTLERNRIATDQMERDRVKAGYGGFEAENRTKAVSQTMKTIRTVLVERYHNMREARRIVQQEHPPLHKMWLAYEDEPEPGFEHDENAALPEGKLVADSPSAPIQAQPDLVGPGDAGKRPEAQRA